MKSGSIDRFIRQSRLSGRFSLVFHPVFRRLFFPSSTYSTSQGSYVSMSSPRQQHGNQQIMLLQQQQQQQQHQQQQVQLQQHIQYMHTQQQQQQQLQQQMQYRSPTGGSPSAIQSNTVPEPNNNTTTSEDSDDSTPHSGMVSFERLIGSRPISNRNEELVNLARFAFVCTDYRD